MRIGIRILGGGLGARTIISSAGSGSYPAFTKAILTIAAGEVTADVTDFPVRVALADMPAGFWSVVASDGSDIQVFDSTQTQLPRDLVTFDSVGDTGDLFFKASLLTASDNIFYVTAGSGAAAPADNSTYGRNNVWTSYNRAFVFTGNSGDDRTGSGNNLTLGGSATLTGGRLVMSGNSDYGYYAVSSYTTWSSFILTDNGSNPSKNHFPINYGNSGMTSLVQLFYLSASSGQLALYDTTNGFSSGVAADGVGIILDRHYWGLSNLAATNRKLWYDGSLTINESVGTSLPSTGAEVRVGYPLADGYKGEVELTYFRNSDPAASWVAAEYSSWFTPNTFYTVTTP